MTPDDTIQPGPFTASFERQQKRRWTEARKDKRFPARPGNSTQDSEQ